MQSDEEKSQLSTTIADILVHHGGIVESKEQSLEFLLPPSLAQSLDIPEQGELNFAYRDDAADVIDASYDSEFFAALGRLFAEKGRMATASYPPYEPRMKNVEHMLAQKFSLTNATFRFAATIASHDLHYLLAYLKYTAVSDEKSEGILAVLVDENTLATADASAESDRILQEAGDANIALPAPEKFDRAILAAHGFALDKARQKLEKFCQSLERRLNRDIRRVYEYYETLKSEARKSLQKKAAGKDLSEQDIADKLEAIAVEQNWKVQDLVSKYAMKIQVEPLSIVHIATSSSVFSIDIKRRLGTRKFQLAYNPLLREIDSFPCEACFSPRGSYCICDDRLHIVCTSCLSPCPHCRKLFCKACEPQGCPRCRHHG